MTLELAKRFSRLRPMNKKFNNDVRAKVFKKFQEDKEHPVVLGYSGIPDFCISTGLPSLDILLGRDKNSNFGIPNGSIIAITGEASNGKTACALNIIKSAILGTNGQTMLPYLIDTEGLLSEEFMKLQGVDPNEIFIDKQRPETLQNAYEKIRNKLRAIRALPIEERIPMLIVLDSMSGLPTDEESELESLSDVGSVGGHARANSRAMRILTPLIVATNSIFVIVAQARADLGFGKVGNPKTFIGARPVKFHAGIIIDIARTEWVKKNNTPVGMGCKILVSKSKVGQPMRSANNVYFDFESGFDRELSLHEALLATELVNKEGRTYKFFKPTATGKHIEYVGEEGIKKLPLFVIEALEKALYKHVAKLGQEEINDKEV